jgi:hypothetical protein
LVQVANLNPQGKCAIGRKKDLADIEAIGEA